MATITTDDYGSTVSRGDNVRADVSSRKAATNKNTALYSRIKSQTSGSTWYTGSLAG